MLDVDPKNLKAWHRKIQNLLSFGEVSDALKAIAQAEKCAVLEDDKVKLRNFRAKIAEIKGKEKAFSQKAFAGPLYEDKAAP